MKHLLTLLLLSAVPLTAQPTDTLTVMTYNVLNYHNAAADRIEHLRTVIQSVEPDILVIQEMWEDLNQHFQTNIFPRGGYSYAPHIGSQTNVSLFFRQDRVGYLGQRIVPTSLRNIVGYELRVQTAEHISFAFWLYGAHLKASDGSDDEQQRADEVTALRNALADLPTDTHYLVAGDFNVYRSSEPAYQTLMNEFAVDLYDPVDRPGNWHNSSVYAEVHTQSTRYNNIGDGGSWGGMDDRFDFILPSAPFRDTAGLWYLDGSYKAYGNDGRHLNDAINYQGNTAVSAEIADALHFGSDHLPVVMDVVVQLLDRGDMNADGRISEDDVDRIVEIILEENTSLTTTEEGLADVNSDGRVDVRDVVVLLRDQKD